ncbi:MAG: T9SS type A sorting domain-containing protein [Flavobacteriales bacterium]|jgi:hypothetical protein
MKKGLLALFAACSALVSQAQLPSGSLAPNFTTTDINGNTHTLYDYLSQGYTVVIDVSATWCGPCWNYHSSGALETLHEQHGVANGGNVIVMFIEGDSQTNNADLNGNTADTQGDWVTGVNYIIADDASAANLLEISYFPTIYTVCPTGIITETGQISAAQHWNFINTTACQTVPTSDGAVLSYVGPSVACADADISIELANLGTNDLTSATITVSGVTPPVTQNWSGNLNRFESELVDLGTVTVTGPMVISISADDNANNNSVDGASLAPSSTTQLRFDIKFDGWPEECSWRLLNDNNQVVHQGGPYTNQADNSTLVFDRWVPSTGCYTLEVNDEYGDGLHGSQWGSGAQDGHFKVYSMENGQVSSDIFIYNGDYDYSQAIAGANVNEVVSVSELNVSESVKAYPNPASDLLTLSYTLGAESEVRFELVNMLGARVMNQYVGSQTAGSYSFPVDLSAVSSGFYLLNVEIDGVTSTLRVSVSK